MAYLVYSQIEQRFNSISSDEKVLVLSQALNHKDINPTATKESSIAYAMGFKLSVSGSGFYEKI